MMPIAEFDGDFGWGYDGVAWYAPSHLLRAPRRFGAFIDRAHQLGVGVILDVVYNHLGPSGNYLHDFDRQVVSQRYENEWGAALNYDDVGAPALREFVLANVESWIREFHFDGFRLDATQQIFDASPTHLVADIAARARASTTRGVIVTAENEPQHARLVRLIQADDTQTTSTA